MAEWNAMHMALGDDERIDGLVAFPFTTDRRDRIRGQHEELTLSDDDNLVIGQTRVVSLAIRYTLTADKIEKARV